MKQIDRNKMYIRPLTGGHVLEPSGVMKRRIRAFMELYGLTEYTHLARLLGLRAGGTQVWKWMNTATRPSQRYTARMLQLSMWAQEYGLVLTEVDRVDWDLDIIVMRIRRGTRRYISSRDWTDVPADPKLSRDGFAGLHTRPQLQDSSRVPDAPAGDHAEGAAARAAELG